MDYVSIVKASKQILRWLGTTNSVCCILMFCGCGRVWYDPYATESEPPVCTDGECQAATCSDGFTNQGETDLDCGGKCGATCENDKACLAGVDCVSGYCSTDFVCAPEGPASCDDGLHNQDEDAIDCGGSCDACAALGFELDLFAEFSPSLVLEGSSSTLTWTFSVGSPPLAGASVSVELNNSDPATSTLNAPDALLSIVEMDVSDSDLTAFPTGLNQLANLRVLNLSNNAISGALSPDLASLRNLEELYLAGNHLESINASIFGVMTKLSTVDLSNNNLSETEQVEILAQLHAARHFFENGAPTIDLEGNGSFVFYDPEPLPEPGASNAHWVWNGHGFTPITGSAIVYDLQNDVNGEGFSTWSIRSDWVPPGA